MKNFQRNLFIVLAAALCGTCAYQWSLQSRQLTTIERQNQQLFKNATDIQNYTNSIRLRDDQIAQLQERVSTLKQTLVSNDQQIIEGKQQLARLQSSSDLLSNEIAQYKTAVDKFEGKLKEAYDGEKKLAGQRDELVQKLNESIEAQNKLTGKYNDLVDRFNKLQAPPPAK